MYFHHSRIVCSITSASSDVDPLLLSHLPTLEVTGRTQILQALWHVLRFNNIGISEKIGGSEFI